MSTKEYEIGIGVTVERCCSPRFEVHIPVIFDWLDASGVHQRSGGFTRDISQKGVFAWCESECPPCGITLGIALLLPGIEPTSKAWRMKSTGRVVRTKDSPQGNIVVATLDDPRAEVLADDPA